MYNEKIIQYSPFNETEFSVVVIVAQPLPDLLMESE